MEPDIEAELEIMNWTDRNGLSKRTERMREEVMGEIDREPSPPLWEYVILGLVLLALGLTVSFW